MPTMQAKHVTTGNAEVLPCEGKGADCVACGVCMLLYVTFRDEITFQCKTVSTHYKAHNVKGSNKPVKAKIKVIRGILNMETVGPYRANLELSVNCTCMEPEMIYQFGGTAIPSVKCPLCKQTAFVVNKESSCCGEPIDLDGKHLHARRVTGRDKRFNRRSLTPPEKLDILNTQGHKCFFCSLPFFDTWFITKKMKYPSMLTPCFDHIVPLVYSGDNTLNNFVAACRICNMIKFDRVFNTVESVIKYIMSRRERLQFEVVE